MLHDKCWYGDWIYIAGAESGSSHCFIGRFINVWHGDTKAIPRIDTIIFDLTQLGHNEMYVDHTA